MEQVAVNAYGKVNFTLDVVGSADGYHLIDSLVCTIGLYDRVQARPRSDGEVHVTMRGMPYVLPPEKNNAHRAAAAFVATFGTRGADISIEKHIPVGGGLGGSSADAAGVLRALSGLFHVRDMAALKALADGLGSDTGYLLTGGCARITGRGERVTPVSGMAPLWLLLICPGRGVSAGACYAQYDALGKTYPPQTGHALRLLQEEGTMSAAHLFSNALTEGATVCNGAVGRALEEARRLSPIAGMSGSGSTCYAVFENKQACLAARKAYRGRFRTFCVRTLPAQIYRGALAHGRGAKE